MSTYFQGSTFSEIAAFLTIVTILGGALAWLIKRHHMDTFLTKKAYWAQRRDDDVAAEKAAIEAKADREKDEGATATHRDIVLKKLEEVNANQGTMMLKFAEWQGEIDKRLSVLEDRSDRRRAGPRRRGVGAGK